MFKELPSYKLLRRILDYDGSTGKFKWKVAEPDMFQGGKYTPERACRAWNAVRSGKPAFTYVSKSGYVQGGVFGKIYLAHRVAYSIHHGCDVNGFVDHINGVRSDNRIENLRLVSVSGNARNAKRYRTNTSGITGVVWHKASRKWAAQIVVAGKNIALGLYDEKEGAATARREAEIKYGFHENHGRKG